MPAYQLLWQEERENELRLMEQLDKELSECVEVNLSYRNKVRTFMAERKIWHLSEMDYSKREEYHDFLTEHVSPASFRIYEKAFDQIKQHSIRNQFREIKGKNTKLRYEKQILFLLYHPDPMIVSRFEKARKLTDFVWDFRVEAPERMKRQVFHVLNFWIDTLRDDKQLRRQMNALHVFYEYCVAQRIEDIEIMELYQIKKFRDFLGEEEKEKRTAGIVDAARKTLFLQADEIHWNAQVWYLDRFHFQPERIEPSIPVKSLSFLEVTHRRNRELLKQYMRYGLGITNLTINSLQSEFLYVRNFLEELVQEDDQDICRITEEQMDDYFREIEGKEIQAATYNKIVMSIQHFFNFLQVRRYIEKIPFSAGYYLRKTIQQHHDRSVELEVSMEVLQKLYLFPEEIRLMYLHLWGVGLRISEVCTLKGDSYCTQGRDTWIQIYQIKMKKYKRIPIPQALFHLMAVYLKKYGIKADDYVFQNQRGGPYHFATFRKRMLEYCEENQIQKGEYIFRSHDYRHSLATLFYDKKVSIQGIRDYLGHTYEEMTRQYIDYMPRKLAGANDDYFSQNGSLAAKLIKEKRVNDGKPNIFKGDVKLPGGDCGTKKESGEESLL